MESDQKGGKEEMSKIDLIIIVANVINIGFACFSLGYSLCTLHWVKEAKKNVQ